MLAGEEVAPEELAVALGRFLFGHDLAFLDTPVEAAYLVNQEELNRIGEADEEGICLCLREGLRPEVELCSYSLVEVALVDRAHRLEGAEKAEARVALPLQHGTVGLYWA